MLRIAIVLALLPGCRQLLDFDDVAIAPAEDGPPDTGDTPPPPVCFGTVATICLRNAPTEDFIVPSSMTQTVSTSVGCAETVDGTTVDACVIAGKNVQIDGTLRASGERALVVIATGDAKVTGLIDVASHSLPANEAGAGPGLCPPTTVPTNTGGGAGGSFVAAGGSGGNGGGGTGGIAGPVIVVEPLTGGCNGSLGAGSSLVARGHGGGGLLAIARTITVAGTINASGAGGPGGAPTSGGGGGGSGGLIFLEASSSISISGTGLLIAQGGGGGGGGSGGGQAGMRGGDPDPLQPGIPALGGVAGDAGAGDGGSGGTTSVGGAGENGGGKPGGGGGGATGKIRATAPSVVNIGVTSPAAVTD